MKRRVVAGLFLLALTVGCTANPDDPATGPDRLEFSVTKVSRSPGVLVTPPPTSFPVRSSRAATETAEHVLPHGSVLIRTDSPR